VAILPWRNNRIEKAAPPLPSGAQVTQFTAEELQGINNQQQAAGVFQALSRMGILPSVPFGPSNPLTPSAINPVGEDGRPDPRRWEYPVAWNIFVTEQRLVPWKVLRVAADQIDILRRCVEVVKNKTVALDWDFAFSESASEMIARSSGKDHIRAMQEARDKYTDDIARMRDFWTTPDRINGLNFGDWLVMVLEEVLVLDALAIYPHPDMKGDLHSLEILDGSTIKPLLDDRGMRPQNPFPAYQQMLYGFPRGEFLATSDDPSMDGNYSADELIYAIRNRRTHTPYGYSPVERALPLADIYLRRQQWLRAEFTDGVTPDLMFLANEVFGSNPDLLRAWENVFNDDMSGQTEQRKRMRIIPDGLTPVDLTGHSEKFSPTVDEYLIKGISGHFGVMPTEIGYTPASGLGGQGHQDGEAESGSVIGMQPLWGWLEDLISDISYKFLGCPRELQFQFDGGRKSETLADAQRRDTELKGAQRSINEARAELGLPLIDSPEADAPMLVTSNGLYFVTEAGVVAAGAQAQATPQEGQEGTSEASESPTGTDAPPTDQNDSETPPKPEGNQPSQTDSTDEVKAFLKWAKKGNTSRDFEFKTLDPMTASAFNRAAINGDMELVKSLADVVLGKALSA
jgi:hypothetical protein